LLCFTGYATERGAAGITAPKLRLHNLEAVRQPDQLRQLLDIRVVLAFGGGDQVIDALHLGAQVGQRTFPGEGAVLEQFGVLSDGDGKLEAWGTGFEGAASRPA
jgi:hypothetical protein